MLLSQNGKCILRHLHKFGASVLPEPGPISVMGIYHQLPSYIMAAATRTYSAWEVSGTVDCFLCRERRSSFSGRDVSSPCCYRSLVPCFIRGQSGSSRLRLSVALLAIAALTSKKPTPHEMAELAERIVNGTCGRWDVDDYEHWSPKDPEARALWNRTMTVGGPPEELVGLDEAQKNELRSAIRTLRQLGNPRL